MFISHSNWSIHDFYPPIRVVGRENQPLLELEAAVVLELLQPFPLSHLYQLLFLHLLLEFPWIITYKTQMLLSKVWWKHFLLPHLHQLLIHLVLEFRRLVTYKRLFPKVWWCMEQIEHVDLPISTKWYVHKIWFQFCYENWKIVYHLIKYNLLFWLKDDCEPFDDIIESFFSNNEDGREIFATTNMTAVHDTKSPNGICVLHSFSTSISNNFITMFYICLRSYSHWIWSCTYQSKHSFLSLLIRWKVAC